MRFILSCIGGFTIGLITSLFNLGYFTGNWQLNPPGIIVNVVLCFLWVFFIHFILCKRR